MHLNPSSLPGPLCGSCYPPQLPRHKIIKCSCLKIHLYSAINIDNSDIQAQLQSWSYYMYTMLEPLTSKQKTRKHFTVIYARTMAIVHLIADVQYKWFIKKQLLFSRRKLIFSKALTSSQTVSNNHYKNCKTLRSIIMKYIQSAEMASGKSIKKMEKNYSPDDKNTFIKKPWLKPKKL